MSVKTAILVSIILCSCKTGLIDCPEARGPRAKPTNINTRALKAEDLYVSSSKEHPSQQDYEKLKEQKEDVKDLATIEEWDCPRPGRQKNKKIVKNNIRRIEKKMQADKKRHETDSLILSDFYNYKSE